MLNFSLLPSGTFVAFLSQLDVLLFYTLKKKKNGPKKLRYVLNTELKFCVVEAESLTS